MSLNFPLPSAIFGFHTSQAVEKLLKALIAAKGEVFPFTHKLSTLEDQLRNLGESVPPLPCGFTELQPHAVLTRYDEAAELDNADRKRFIETVDVLRAWVEERIGALGV